MRKYMLLPTFFFVMTFISCEKMDYLFGDGYHSVNKEPITFESVEYIAVFGDIQYYMDNDRNANTYKGTIDWIKAQSDQGVQFDCILHTGDITNYGTTTSYQRYYDKTHGLAGIIPYYSLIGDHDYKKYTITSRDSTFFSEYNDFEANRQHRIAMYKDGYLENSIYETIVNGQKIFLVCLEIGPRPDVVSWANNFIHENPGTPCILMTHEYLEAGGGRRTENLKMASRMKKGTYTTPDEIWEKLIAPNDNVIAVLCGHVGGLYAVTKENNNFGHEVVQIQHNIQGPDYRDGNWLMLWSFPELSDSASVSIMNCRNGQYYENNQALFKFRYRDENRFRKVDQSRLAHNPMRAPIDTTIIYNPQKGILKQDNK